MCSCMWWWGRLCAHEFRYMWRSDPQDQLELELQAVVSYSTWVLGTELQFSGRAVRALNHETTSLPV